MYNQLNPEKREIRLLYLDPSNTTQIQVKLETVSLYDEPTYEALSYCWGHPQITAPIQVNGQTKQLTVNLEAALREFREQENGDVLVL